MDSKTDYKFLYETLLATKADLEEQHKALGAEIKRLIAQRDGLAGALKFMLDVIPEPPDSNCSCHISPPCNDCTEYASEREAFEFAKAAITELGK